MKTFLSLLLIAFLCTGCIHSPKYQTSDELQIDIDTLSSMAPAIHEDSKMRIQALQKDPEWQAMVLESIEDNGTYINIEYSSKGKLQLAFSYLKEKQTLTSIALFTNKENIAFIKKVVLLSLPKDVFTSNEQKRIETFIDTIDTTTQTSLEIKNYVFKSTNNTYVMMQILLP